jgi:excinuclease ABC subunit A
VEHDEDTIKASDWLVDIGPGAGVNGGSVVHSGSYKEILKNKDSITGAFLSGKESIPTPKKRRKVDKSRQLKIMGAKENNLQNVTVDIPLGLLTAVTGVSGSGKSSLVEKIPFIKVIVGKEALNSGMVPWYLSCWPRTSGKKDSSLVNL